MQQAVGRGHHSIGPTGESPKMQGIMILQDDDPSYDYRNRLFRHTECQRRPKVQIANHTSHVGSKLPLAHTAHQRYEQDTTLEPDFGASIARGLRPWTCNRLCAGTPCLAFS